MNSENRIKRILLKAKKQVFGDMLGNNLSLFHGEGFEFTELREYIYGDDIRKIDWKTTAKLGRPYVKIYTEEIPTPATCKQLASYSPYPLAPPTLWPQTIRYSLNMTDLSVKKAKFYGLNVIISSPPVD